MAEERRVVTLLFSDVTGSTAMGESSDPEDVRAILGRYYAIAREVIGAHGGTVEKFVGDAVMAVFGIPQAHGDDAERALAAALALRRAVADDAQTEQLSLRIGVNTGEVVASRRTGDAADFLVTGDAVNIAARLQQNAEPGSIMVGGRTRRAVTGFAFGEERRLDVKGKRDPIDASVLVNRLADRRGPLAPFLGRGDDLAQLDLLARRAFSERRPQLITITAPAGTGKSRLVEEFARRVDGATVATAQCVPYGAAVTFLPLRGLVRSLFGVARDEDMWSAVENAFIDAGHPAEDARRLATIIGMTLGDETQSERRDRDEVFSAWRLLIETFAARGPLVVVFEDLHWASDTLLDLAEHITMSRMATPLVIFALARPELLDRKPGWGGGRRNFTALGLEPLSETQTRELVGCLTEGAPASITGRIVERSGGNPFFAAELARAYQERRREGATDAEIVLPDSVHATVLARIDALAAEERSILEFGAVTGRTVSAAAIHTLLPDVDEGRICRALDALAQRDLLVPQGGGAYTYRHIVIREVAYATLPRAERVKAHLRLAQWLETTAARSNERAELVAYHYRQAIALSPGARLPESLPAAMVVDALERAARAASTATAHREASELLREAIRLAPREDHIRLLELWGDLLQFGSDAMNAYKTAYERWKGTPEAERDPRVGARVLVKSLLVFARWAGSLAKPLTHDEFVVAADEAGRLLARTPDEVVEAWLACARSFEVTRYLPPDPDTVARMIADVERAVALFAARGDAEAESATLDALGSIHQSNGDPARALAVARQRIAASSGLSLLERVDAWASAVWNLVYLGRFDEAIATWRDARKAIRSGEPGYMLAHATGWATYAAAVSGRWDTAIEIADVLLGLREDALHMGQRFTYPGWVGALRVVSARQDTTRLARYSSVFASIAAPEHLYEPMRAGWMAVIDRDAAAAKRYLATPYGPRDRHGELIALLLFEFDEPLADEEIAAIESHSQRAPPVLTLRLQLARAVNGDAAALRKAIAALDKGHLAPDAARAATLLALRTKDSADHADAKRRLEALGDRAYLQRLQEG